MITMKYRIPIMMFYDILCIHYHDECGDKSYVKQDIDESVVVVRVFEGQFSLHFD